ncbi:hypothetical protein E2C01_034313 [Portunus trituberculatus]|uniref:Uncharacterized protein n=1 Tax=Portunus trituberculatus TaxID=210409 RepID=A0A5B7F5E7_PORTR|nr:hypothetical protein [Portunus trituberculatus]
MLEGAWRAVGWVPRAKSRHNVCVEAASGQLQSVSQQLPGGPNESLAAPASSVGVPQRCLPLEESGCSECCSSLCTYNFACVIKVKPLPAVLWAAYHCGVCGAAVGLGAGQILCSGRLSDGLSPMKKAREAQGRG